MLASACHVSTQEAGPGEQHDQETSLGYRKRDKVITFRYSLLSCLFLYIWITVRLMFYSYIYLYTGVCIINKYKHFTLTHIYVYIHIWTCICDTLSWFFLNTVWNLFAQIVKASQHGLFSIAACSPPHRIKISRLLFSFCQCLPSAPLISFGTIWYQNIMYFHYLLLWDQWIYNHMTIAAWSPKYSSQPQSYWKYTLFLVFPTFLFYSIFESLINFQVIYMCAFYI